VPITPARKIWMDGDLVPWDEAKIHVLSHVVQYGTGVFEGIRCYQTPRGPAVFRLTDHLRRLFRSAVIYRTTIPYSLDELHTAIKDTIRANGLSECYIRPLAYQGYGEMGVNLFPTPAKVTIAAWPWGSYLGKDSVENGVRVKVSSWRRHDPNIVPPAAKATGQYINSALAKAEALEAGYEEAVMLSPLGHIADGSGENLFVIRDGELLTPPESAGILLGITRDTLIRIARDHGYKVQQRNLVRSDLYTADEAFLCGTAAEVVPVRDVDGRVLGTNGRGPITKELQEAFFAAVRGESEQYAAWNELVG
jgi:branched-chain amino acid aminotransferase